MRDVGSFAEDSRTDRGYFGLALEVIRKLSAMRTVEDNTLLDELACRLYDAVTSQSAHGFGDVIAAFEAARISPQELTLSYIPEVARRLGRDWEGDQISFTDVTIGATRLQGILREVASGWTADGSVAESSAAVLMIVPLGEQHTLGALVAATWLRRNGVSVSVQIAPSPQDLGQLLQRNRFDAAFISVGSCSRIETCAKLIRTIRTLAPASLRVVIGGAAVATRREDLLSIGADSVTTDLPECLELLGLSPARRRARAR